MGDGGIHGGEAQGAGRQAGDHFECGWRRRARAHSGHHLGRARSQAAGTAACCVIIVVGFEMMRNLKVGEGKLMMKVAGS